MRLFFLLIPAAIAALITVALAPLARRLAFAVGAVDHPGPRKIHSEPIPRFGGLAVILSATFVIVALYSLKLLDREIIATRLLTGLAVGLLPILFISIFDDIRPLPAMPKFLAHTLGATIVVIDFGIRLGPVLHLFGKEIHIGWMAIPVSIVWIVGVTNAF